MTVPLSNASLPATSGLPDVFFTQSVSEAVPLAATSAAVADTAPKQGMTGERGTERCIPAVEPDQQLRPVVNSGVAADEKRVTDSYRSPKRSISSRSSYVQDVDSFTEHNSTITEPDFRLIVEDAAEDWNCA